MVFTSRYYASINDKISNTFLNFFFSNNSIANLTFWIYQQLHLQFPLYSYLFSSYIHQKNVKKISSNDRTQYKQKTNSNHQLSIYFNNPIHDEVNVVVKIQRFSQHKQLLWFGLLFFYKFIRIWWINVRFMKHI